MNPALFQPITPITGHIATSLSQSDQPAAPAKTFNDYLHDAYQGISDGFWGVGTGFMQTMAGTIKHPEDVSALAAKDELMMRLEVAIVSKVSTFVNQLFQMQF